jgi:hypothetical protein
MRGNSQAAIRHEQAVRGRRYYFDRIDGRRSGIFSGKHLGRSSEHLKWTDQVEDLDLRSGNKHDSTR